MTRQVPPCLTATSDPSEHLRSLLETQRQSAAHLIEDLRHRVAERSYWGLGGKTAPYDRLRREIDSAFETYKRAEAKLEILISKLS